MEGVREEDVRAHEAEAGEAAYCCGYHCAIAEALAGAVLA
jgi:hypothetical protein